MATRDELAGWLDELLMPNGVVEDVSNNGLQVEGAAEVERAVFGVDGCLALFEAAVDLDADFVFVHHGLSWGGGIRWLTGPTAARVRTLLANGISLYASHLPLDMHPAIGHNAEIAKALGLTDRQPFFAYQGIHIGYSGTVANSATIAGIADSLGAFLGCSPAIVGDAEAQVRRVGIVSGGAPEAVEACPPSRVDCLVTGEFDHQHVHAARELGIPVVAGGHYATETPGVKAVMSRVKESFEIACEFVDMPTGL